MTSLMFYLVAGATPEEIGTKLTENCHLVSELMLGNKLKLTADKTPF